MTYQDVNLLLAKRFNDAIMAPEAEQLKRTPNDDTGYIRRHREAWISPRLGAEKAIVEGIRSLSNFAMAAEQQTGTPIANDYYSAPLFANMARSLNGFLSTDVGRLCAGFLSGMLQNIWREAGFTEEL